MSPPRPWLAALSFLSFLAPLPLGCDTAGSGTQRGPVPPTSFTFDEDQDPGFVNVSGDLTMRSCAFAVRDEGHLGQYVADGQADTSPTFTTLQVYFTETNQTKPAVGVLAVPAQADVKITLPSPYGVMNGNGGTVKVTEADGWRTIAVEAAIAGTGGSGVLKATLVCGI
ncbi:MAG: hypothetical protein EP329_00480 [Deltaproteobacteria bacterium]|nr:MAG: hypothetical protein EP329_00480 [Deltaproteobacteria bacterium]